MGMAMRPWRVLAAAFLVMGLMPGLAKADTFKVQLIDLNGNPLNKTVQVQVFNATGDDDVPFLMNPVTVNNAFKVTINVLNPGAEAPKSVEGETAINVPTAARPLAIRLQFTGQDLREANLVRLENSNHALRVPMPVAATPPPCPPPAEYYYQPAHRRGHRFFRHR